MTHGLKALLCLLAVTCCAPFVYGEQTIEVGDHAALQAAVRKATPGTHIRIRPGNYARGIYATDLKGTPDQPIVIEGADPDRPPLFEGGNEAWHLSDCCHLTLRNIALRGQSGNGINIDDAGTMDTPTHHIRLERLHVTDVGPKGNCDAIKLTGLDDFLVDDCLIEGWGGQSVDLVGCHRGQIQRCTFRGKSGFSQHTGIQTKGGSCQIDIQRCLFWNVGDRAVNIGGSTGLQFFRPQGTLYEAKDIRVQGCVFVGSEAPLAFVGVDGAEVRYNTIYRPKKWVMRILQETTAKGFVPCRNGLFERNLIVYRLAEVRSIANIGSHTEPDSFRLVDNLWYCEDWPEASRPALPVRETGGVYNVNPKLANPAAGQFVPQNPLATAFGYAAFEDQPTAGR